ncbi:MAG: hypothetical protein NTV52_25570 [Acidobacteria bacterium]|nr:hypothetical protein [Acidobacteriota bacterium]
MVVFNAIQNGLFSAVVGGILAGVGIQWLTYLIKERGPDVALGEAFAIYLGVIAGVVFGFIVGVICSPLMPFSTYLKGIGVVVGGLVVVCALITGVRWLGEEREPRIQGKLVDFEYELRAPKGFSGPPETAALSRWKGETWSGPWPLVASEFKEREGRWVVHTSLEYSQAGGDYAIRFSLGKELIPTFSFPHAPSAKNLEWSDWMDADERWSKSGAGFQLRHRLVFRPEEVPPTPQPSFEETVAKEFAALEESAPVGQWLRFLGYRDVPAERMQRIAAVVEQRQGELAKLIRSAEKGERELGLLGAAQLEKPSREVQEAILQEGRLVAADIRKYEAGDLTLDPRDRFMAWRTAWWRTRHQMADYDAGPLREICEAAARAKRPSVLAEVADNAKGMLERMPTVR